VKLVVGWQSLYEEELEKGGSGAMTILVEGKRYKVIEGLGFQGGYQTKAVETEEGERIAVKRGGIWTWWTAADRLQPRGRVEAQKK